MLFKSKSIRTLKELLINDSNLFEAILNSVNLGKSKLFKSLISLLLKSRLSKAGRVLAAKLVN